MVEPIPDCNLCTSRPIILGLAKIQHHRCQSGICLNLTRYIAQRPILVCSPCALQAEGGKHVGGGIFSNGEPLAFYYDPTAKNVTKLLVATVPIIPLGSDDMSADLNRARITSDAVVDDSHQQPRVQAASNTSVFCQYWGLEARCTPFVPMFNQSGHIVATWNDVTCELDYRVHNATMFNETWVLLATMFPINSTHNIDQLYARSCAMMVCTKFPRCVPYTKKPNASFASFNLKASGGAFATVPSAVRSPQRTASTQRSVSGLVPLFNQTLVQPPADVFWSFAATNAGQALPANQFSLPNGGRQVQSTSAFKPSVLYTVAITGLNQLV
jgi:hypothetical protein